MDLRPLILVVLLISLSLGFITACGTPNATTTDRTVSVPAPLALDPAGSLLAKEISVFDAAHAAIRQGRNGCTEVGPITLLTRHWRTYCRQGDEEARASLIAEMRARSLPEACEDALLIRPPRVPDDLADACPLDAVVDTELGGRPVPDDR